MDDEIVCCEWKHPVEANFISDDKYFLSIPGLTIFNERIPKDYCMLDDNQF